MLQLSGLWGTFLASANVGAKLKFLQRDRQGESHRSVRHHPVAPVNSRCLHDSSEESGSGLNEDECSLVLHIFSSVDEVGVADIISFSSRAIPDDMMFIS